MHYGEENSRHFRYLCMKSEYDKMFYQHHNMIAATTTPSATVVNTKTMEVANPSAKTSDHHRLEPTRSSTSTKSEKSPTSACQCRPSKTMTADICKNSSDDHNISSKSSDMGMREVLEHIQRFCNQMQMNDLKCASNSGFRMEDAIKLNKQIFEDDDEEDSPLSSDGMTPRSDAGLKSKYGGATMRSTARGNVGGGDA